jgi:FkbM family methyltransferase
MAAFLAAITFRGTSIAFDVGANIGVYSLVGAASTGATIVGFEPVPRLGAAFEALARVNELACILEPIALGTDTGHATLYLSSATDTSNSLNPGFRAASGTIEVPVERLDDYVQRTGRVPGVVKIDTESTEPDVLRGARGLLEVHRPWILCEVLAGLTESALMAILDPIGYRYHMLASDGVSDPIEEIVGDPSYRNRDWLFAPDPVGAEFRQLMADWLVAIAATAR